MTCYVPRPAFFGVGVNAKTGNKPVIMLPRGWRKPDNWEAEVFQLPCGQCIGCRLDYSSMWAIRAVHEAQLHDDNCFITLTYNDYHLPFGGTLVKKDFQDFMKRFRKRVDPVRIRFFQCGEYGEERFRPHFHSLIFGYDFSDRVLYSERDGVKLYTSKVLESLWTFGFSSVGDCTFDSAAYVARYATKKIVGSKADEVYNSIDEQGNVFTRIREYANMSRKPGVGKQWFDKYGDHVYSRDFLITPSGAKIKPPRYYDNLYSAISPSDFLQIKQDRIDTALLFQADNTPERLGVREIIQNVKFNMLPRNLK